MTDHTTQQFWNEYAKPGATHYNPETKDWYRVEGDTALAWATVEGGWVPAAYWHERKHQCVARPSSAWSGDGLPPAGIECMAAIRKAPTVWHKVRVIARDDDRVIFRWLDGDRIDCIGEFALPGSFKPLPTPAQLAEEKFKNEVDAIVYDIAMHFGNPRAEQYIGLATKLHDLGYRKPEKE